MEFSKFFLILAISWLMGTSAKAVREFPLKPTGHDLAARIDISIGSMMDCWNALLQIQSCTNEIVLFFLNGEAYLGLDCCRAIRVITRQCWPAMLTSLGFTTQEGAILHGYCDASTAPPLPSPPVPVVESPVPSPA